MKIPSNTFSIVVFFWFSTVLSLPLNAGVAFDYDGDEKADLAVRRNSNSYQYISKSSDFDIARIAFGRQPGDVPVSGDFDGDGIYDIAIRRPADQTWYIINSSGIDALTNHEDGISRVRFGRNMADIPVPADYDGDGKTDFAVRRPSNQYWYIRNSSGVDTISGNSDGITRIRFGLQAADIPVPADYDGDGKADLAVRRPSDHLWFIRNSAGVDTLTGHADGISRVLFGRQSTDIPVVADYDGDGKTDIAVRRPATFQWYIQNSSAIDATTGHSDGISRIAFGRDSYDIPVVADYDGDGKADIAVRRPSNHTWYVRNSSGTDLRTRNSDGITRARFGLQSQDVPLAQPPHLIWLVSDIDNDGLSNQQEMALGTDITNADSDNDGLSDGEEINKYQTDPLNADSDGDGVNDGDEVAAGRDPKSVDTLRINDFSSQSMAGLKGRLSYGERRAEGYLAPFNDVMQFNTGDTATFYENNLFGASNRFEYTYAVQSNNELVFNLVELYQETEDCNEITRRGSYLSLTWDMILEIERICTLNGFENDEVIIDYGVSERVWQLVQGKDASIVIDTHFTNTNRIVLSEAELQIWSADVPTFVNEVFESQRFEFIYKSNNIKISLSDIGLEGIWIVPLHYLPHIGDNSSIGITSENFMHDRIEISGSEAVGFLSQQTFAFSETEFGFILETPEQKLVYTPLEAVQGQFMVQVDRYLNGTLDHTYVADMAKQVDEALPWHDPVTELPYVYSASRFSWLKSHRPGGQIALEDLYAFHFKSNGSLRRGIRYNSFLQESLEFVFSDGWSWETLEDNTGIVKRQHNSFTSRNRFWVILDSSDPNRIPMLEYELYGTDSNSDGEITDDELGHLVPPRLNIIERIDLSAYGDIWDNTDFDKDGLTNKQEEELGTDVDNADTDGDGFSDPDEVIAGSNPTDSSSVPLLLRDVTFSDENLQACLSALYPDNMLVARIVNVFCDSQNINNLDGLDQLFTIEHLRLTDNNITDLSKLIDLSRLRILNLSNNNITDITPLSALSASALWGLSLNNNLIRDIAPLAELHNLIELSLTKNLISDISSLAELTNLSNLRLGQNLITNISGISNLYELQYLELQQNQITEIAALQGLTQLSYINLASNNIESISPLVALPSLSFIDITGNDTLTCDEIYQLERQHYPINIRAPSSCPGELVSNIQVPDAALAACIQTMAVNYVRQLTNINCENAGIADITGLDRFFALGTVDLTNNEISGLPLMEEITELYDLRLAGNKIESIGNIGVHSRLNYLDLSDNLISDINDIKNLTSLNRLYLYQNHINDITPLAELSALNTLILGDNQISDISPLANMRNLNLLFLTNNRISDISALTNLTNLGIVTLANNPITDISPINDLPNLTGLNLSGLNLNDLSGLEPNSNLTQLLVSNNNLSSITELSAFTDLKILYLNNNQVTELNPLSELPSLTVLSISNNGLEDISPLTQNSATLHTIILRDNDLSILDALFELRELRELELIGNDQIACSDIERLQAQFPNADITGPEHCNVPNTGTTRNDKESVLIGIPPAGQVVTRDFGLTEEEVILIQGLPAFQYHFH